MAKNIRWQIPFVSIQGVHYQVDIYDEGTFTPVQLTAGPTPFVTDEDASDDFFCPIRTQTGTLQVCTLKPDGTYITLDELLPSNNIARPVRLVNVGTGAIEWKGFLSCEAYSQDYIGIPQIIDLPINGLLETMASVQADQTKMYGLNTVGNTIINILETFIDKAGIAYFDEFYVPSVSCGRNIITKQIDSTILFEKKEYSDENSTTYIVSGLSLQDCLQRIAVYMGWCIRENSNTLYFEAANNMTGYNRHYRQSQISPGGEVTHYWVSDITDTAISQQNISSMQWIGEGHKRSIAAGAKSVEVIANLGKYELKMELPDCPTGSLSERYGELEDSVYLYLLGNSNMTAYSNIGFAYYSAYVGLFLTKYERYSNSSFLGCFGYIAAGSSSSSSIKYTISHSPTVYVPFFAGAFLSKYSWEDSASVTVHQTTNALYCVFFPNSLQASWTEQQSDFDKTNIGHIFSMSNILNYRCNSGYLRLFANADTIFCIGSESPVLFHSTTLNHEWLVTFELQYGNKWWNGTSWQSSPCTFNASMIKSGFVNNWESTMPILETEGLLIPITDEMSGIVTLKIWPMASEPDYGSGGYKATLEMIFSELTLEHILPYNEKLSDRGENHYFRLLGTNFRDEISIGAELASMLNNIPSPSLIMEDATTPMTELNYGSEQSPEMRRPEVDLLNRLAAYYGAARQRLELEVAHPTAAPLPLLKLNGINDGKVYLPLSESRDWQTGVCKLTCFEMPQ